MFSNGLLQTDDKDDDDVGVLSSSTDLLVSDLITRHNLK